MTQPKFGCYQCDGKDCNVPKEQLSFCENAIICFKSSLKREDDGPEVHGRGCITNAKYLQLACSARMQASNNARYRTECCEEKYCNGGAFPALMEAIPEADQGINVAKVSLAIALPLCAVGVVALLVSLYYRNGDESSPSERCRRERRLRWRSRDGDSISGDGSSSEPKINSTDDAAKDNSSSGRNLSQEISLLDRYPPSGNFSRAELWRGTRRRRESVLVKIYPSSSATLWRNEAEVYAKLRDHANDVLRYVGSSDCNPQLWLVTRCPANGSLASYLALTTTRLNNRGMLRACSSLARGLSYLHERAAMAHRNLGSSTSLFVERDGRCVIGGFELAVTQEGLGGAADFFESADKRYMSPELLEPSFEDEIWSLEGFQLADVYSLGLVFWEICCSRACVDSHVAPFSEWLAMPEPTVEEMRRLVLVEGRRPGIPESWHADPIVGAMGSMIEDCWRTKAEKRMPLEEIRKTLKALANT